MPLKVKDVAFLPAHMAYLSVTIDALDLCELDFVVAGRKLHCLGADKQLTQPILMGVHGGDAAAAEAMDGGGGLTRALHTLTKRMLDAQEAWERKKAAIEVSRSEDFTKVLSSLILSRPDRLPELLPMLEWELNDDTDGEGEQGEVLQQITALVG